MALKLKDYKANLVKAINEMNQTREREALDVTADGIELVKLRVINKGTNANGSRFKPYSRNILPWFFFGSSFNSPPAFNVQSKVAQLKKAKPLGASYFDWRGITGRVTVFKNFSFTNDMWASIRSLVKSKSKASVTVEIKSSIRKYTETIIPAHSNREKINILQLSKTEREMVFKAFAERRLNILRKYNLIK